MCGRYLITTAPEAMRRMFRYPEQPNFPARYNVAPTQPIPIVRLAEGERQFALVRWGLIPAWVKDPRAFSLLINARGDSVNDKPTFRNAMKRRRCLIPADGFYEWNEQGGRKRPYAVRPADGEPVAFAGLWECWTGPNGEEMETAAIITTDASRDLANHPSPHARGGGAGRLRLLARLPQCRCADRGRAAGARTGRIFRSLRDFYRRQPRGQRHARGVGAGVRAAGSRRIGRCSASKTATRAEERRPAVLAVLTSHPTAPFPDSEFPAGLACA